MLHGNREHYISYAFEQISVGSSVATPTSTKLKPTSGNLNGEVECQAMALSADTNDMYITWDGTDPTSSSGMYLAKNAAPFWLYGPDNCRRLKATRVSADGKLNVTYHY